MAILTPGLAPEAVLEQRARCLWCGLAFTPRDTGGSPQRFCGPYHRRAFDLAARRYVRREITAGRLTVAELIEEVRTEAEFRRRRPNTFTLDIGKPEGEP